MDGLKKTFAVLALGVIALGAGAMILGLGHIILSVIHGLSAQAASGTGGMVLALA